MIPYDFQTPLLLFYSRSVFISIFSLTSFSHFPLQIAFTLLFLSTGHLVPLALLVSVVAPGYILTSGDLELGASRELFSVCLSGLGHLIQYDLR